MKDIDATKGDTDVPGDVKRQTIYVTVDIRHKTPAERAMRLNSLRVQLSSTKEDGTKRTEAKIRSLKYSISILEKK